MLEHLNGGLSELRMEVVAESIGPKHDLRLARILRRALAKPIYKRLCGKPGQLTLLGYTAHKLGKTGEARGLGKKVCHPARVAREPRPAGDQTHDISRSRPRTALIIITDT